VAQFPTDPLVRYDLSRHYKDTLQLVEMERALDETLAMAPIAFAMIWKAWLALEVRGDVADMKTWLDRMPERQRINTRFANALSVLGLISGDTRPALAVIAGHVADRLRFYRSKSLAQWRPFGARRPARSRTAAV
jgi:hypothetical protein